MIVQARGLANQALHLTPNKKYLVVGLDHDSFRVINDNQEPVIYDKNMFDVIESSLPTDWVWERFAKDEYYANPPEMSAPGFYEDWFDRMPASQLAFSKYLMRCGCTPTDLL